MLDNLVPDFILENYANNVDYGQFEAVCLFVDISGFSTVTSTLMKYGNEAAEIMADIMLRVFEPLIEAIYTHQGFITGFAGDAFTALFPMTLAQPFVEALNASLQIQQKMIDTPLQHTAYGNFAFAIKLGLGLGNVEWGIIRPREGQGDQVRASYYFSGKAIDSASNAEHHARKGNLVLNEAVSIALQDYVKTVPIDGTTDFVRFLSATKELPTSESYQPNPAYAEHMAAFIPTAIQYSPVNGEFRQVISVFISLREVQERGQLVDFVQSVFDLQTSYGGYLNRVDFGDKGCNLLMFWGMPTSHENDIARALNFVLALPTITPSSFRAGITYSSMYAGLAGSPQRGEFTTYGNGVNLAARLMMKADWGSVWVDENIYERARNEYNLTPAGDYLFKGFSENQTVYTLGERKSRALSMTDIAFAAYPPVGREAELVKLEDFIQPIFNTTAPQRFAGMVVIEADAGMGKSHFVHYFRLILQLKEHQFTWALCQTDQLQPVPLNPFRYWLRDYFGQSTSNSDLQNKRLFGQKLDTLLESLTDSTLASELNRVRSFLGTLVDLYWDNSPYAQMSAEARHDNTHIALKLLIKAEALRQPLILLLEDIHWLDTESIDFIRQLSRNVENYPLVIIATTRRDIGVQLTNTSFQMIHLPTLNHDAMAGFVKQKLNAPGEAQLIEFLMQRAEGNPFFAEQLLLHMTDEGAIILHEGVWQVVVHQAAMVPPDVNRLLIARLDRLSQQIKEFVQTAAVLGREFDVQILTQMLKDAPIDTYLEGAEQSLVLAPLTTVRYLFKNALLRDVAYQMQLRVRRRELHKLAAEVMEKIHADQLPNYYAELAYHYEAAYQQGASDVQEKACSYLRLAGEELADDFQNTQALDYFTRALDLASNTDYGLRFNLRVQRVDLYHLLGWREEEAADLRELAEVVKWQPTPQYECLLSLKQAQLAYATSNYPNTIQFAKTAIEHAQIVQDAPREAQAYRLWGQALLAQSDYKLAQEKYQQSLQIARAVDDMLAESNALSSLGDVVNFMLNYEEAKSYYEQALNLFEKIGNRSGEAENLHKLGDMFRVRGDLNPARQYYEKALALRREIGDRKGVAQTLNRIGSIFHHTGELGLAHDHYKQALNTFQEIGDRSGEAEILSLFADVLSKQRDFDAARECFEQALAIRSELGERNELANAIFLFGTFLTQRGEYDLAQQYCSRALLIRREIGERAGEADALVRLGLIFQRTHDYAQAIQHYNEALIIFWELGNRQGEADALFQLGYTCSFTGDYSKAKLYWEQSLAIYQEIGHRQRELLILNNLGDNTFKSGGLDQALPYYEKTLQLSREIGQRTWEAVALGNLGRFFGMQGDYAQGRDYSEQALAASQAVSFRLFEIVVWFNLGQIALEQEDYAQAESHFRQALTISQEDKVAHSQAEALAGLMRVAMAQGQTETLPPLLAEFKPIVTDNPSLAGAERTFLALLTTYEAMHLTHDAEAALFLENTYALLQDRADQIGDNIMRRSFLENFREHQRLAQLYAEWQAQPIATSVLSQPAEAIAEHPEITPISAPPQPVIEEKGSVATPITSPEPATNGNHQVPRDTVPPASVSVAETTIPIPTAPEQPNINLTTRVTQSHAAEPQALVEPTKVPVAAPNDSAKTINITFNIHITVYDSGRVEVKSEGVSNEDS